MTDGLVIGTQDIAHKDQMVLRALVRLLEGGVNLRARFSDQLSECHVVFVPAGRPHQLHPACIAVRVWEGMASDNAPEHEADQPAGDLSVHAPLRMTNVMAVLQSAMQRLHGGQATDPVRGLHELFALLTDRMQTTERRRTVVPMSSGQQIVCDFVEQTVHTATSMDTLLSGAYTLGEPHRVSAVEEELIRLVPTYSLRRLVWDLSLRLARAGAALPARAGAYRLLRWPDAAGLSAAGHPRMSALLTTRAMTVEQLCAASEVPETSVRWFLEACVALGLAVEAPTAAQPVAPAADAGSVPTQAPAPAVAARAPAGWLGHLRERLKLW